MMYATRTIFAATIAVMAAKVELPGREKTLGIMQVETMQRERTTPYVFLRCEVGCNWDDTERQAENYELE